MYERYASSTNREWWYRVWQAAFKHTHDCVQFQSPKHIHKNDDDCADGDEGGGGKMHVERKRENVSGTHCIVSVHIGESRIAHQFKWKRCT